jgi:hypothetical protein
MGCHAPVGRKRQFVDEVFSNMGGDNDGLVTRDMFLEFFNRIVVSLNRNKIIILMTYEFRADVWGTSTVLPTRTV